MQSAVFPCFPHTILSKGAPVSVPWCVCVCERENLLNSSKSSTRDAGGVRDASWTGAANDKRLV